MNKIQKNTFNNFTYLLLLLLLISKITIVKSEDKYEQFHKYEPFLIAALITSLILIVVLFLACFTRACSRLNFSRNSNAC